MPLSTIKRVILFSCIGFCKFYYHDKKLQSICGKKPKKENPLVLIDLEEDAAESILELVIKKLQNGKMKKGRDKRFKNLHRFLTETIVFYRKMIMDSNKEIQKCNCFYYKYKHYLHWKRQ